MSRPDYLGYALGLFGIGISIVYPQQRPIGVIAFVLGVMLIARWAWISLTGSVESLRLEFLGLEEKFKAVHDAAPRPTPGVPWYGGNPHPFATWDGRRWQLRGDNVELKKQMEVLCYDAGTLLLKSPKLKRTLARSIRRERDPITRWLKAVRANEEFTKEFHRESRWGNRVETDKVGFIEFLPNVSVRVARRCAALC